VAFTSCLRIARGVNLLTEQAGTQTLIRHLTGDRAAQVFALVRAGLPAEEQELFDAEAAGLPDAVKRAVAELLVLAADNGLPFRFESAPPESVMEYARARRARFTFELEERGITVRLQHSLRHPSWLPTVEIPAAALQPEAPAPTRASS
jgi:hypothetical protein